MASEERKFLEKTLAELNELALESLCARKELLLIIREFDDLVITGDVPQLTQAIYKERFRRSLKRVDEKLHTTNAHRHTLRRKLKKLV